MADWYREQKDYTGTLGIDSFSIAVAFSAGIDMAGEAKITMDEIPINASSTFIEDYFHHQRTSFAEFRLAGTSADGGTFESSRTLVHSPGDLFPETSPWTMTPRVSCMVCSFVDLVPAGAKPGAKSLLRDFLSYQALQAETPLGAVCMVGGHALETEGLLLGRIELAAPSDIADLSAWRSEVLEFFAHVRTVMSFACGERLQAPVTEWIGEGRIELEVVSQSAEKGGGMAPFSSFNYAGIFARAVASHFDPGPNAGSLRVAIEWFNMRSGYREGKLIAAMTVLENLVSANLEKKDLHLRSRGKFRELRAELMAIVERKIGEWAPNPMAAQVELDAIKDKFEDLNRRALKQKIDLLAERWAVDLSDLDAKAIAAAKSARDDIVHTGRFEPKPGAPDLMDHVRLTRELVARFILAALGFEGVYTSHVGGARERRFADGASTPADR